jgi:hypothetical protein
LFSAIGGHLLVIQQTKPARFVSCFVNGCQQVRQSHDRKRKTFCGLVQSALAIGDTAEAVEKLLERRRIIGGRRSFP